MNDLTAWELFWRFAQITSPYYWLPFLPAWFLHAVLTAFTIRVLAESDAPDAEDWKAAAHSAIEVKWRRKFKEWDGGMVPPEPDRITGPQTERPSATPGARTPGGSKPRKPDSVPDTFGTPPPPTSGQMKETRTDAEEVENLVSRAMGWINRDADHASRLLIRAYDLMPMKTVSLLEAQAEAQAQEHGRSESSTKVAIRWLVTSFMHQGEAVPGRLRGTAQRQLDHRTLDRLDILGPPEPPANKDVWLA